MNPKTSHVYGPVPSRRLGRSLGVDLVPYKTCSYDCIYCQLGLTTHKTVEVREWTPLDELAAQVKEKLGTKPDYITLAGSGEPTLYSRLGELIDRIHSMTGIPVAVLTNGSLLWKKEIREQVGRADLVLPSLDAGNSGMFEAVNRPHPELTFERMVEGLIEFRQEYSGPVWLEICLLGGHNAVQSELRDLAALTRRIRPERVQLNTATRPPAMDFADAVERHVLQELAGYFSPAADVIADFPDRQTEAPCAATRDSVLQVLRRRACSVEDIARGLGIHRNEAIKHLKALEQAGEVEYEMHAGKLYYSVREKN